MPPTTVLYHGPHCPDGFASALAAWQYYGDDAQYLPVTYGQPPPDIPPDHHVLIVDFSYPAEVLLALRQAHVALGSTVTVLDHHASAQRDLETMTRARLAGLTILFDMAESGATLTWKWLQTRGAVPEPSHQPDVWAAVEDAMPRFYAYIRDRDLWQWALPFSKEVSLALQTQERTWDSWEAFLVALDDDQGFATIVAEGTAIRRYSEQLVREQANRAVVAQIGGYPVPIVNATTLFSEVGDYLCTTQDIPFCAYYYLRSDGKVQWGLRGHDRVDLSMVAKGYGGGGHRNAAGFVTSQDTLLSILTEVRDGRKT